jgi:tripeptidyl-peptidase-1
VDEAEALLLTEFYEHEHKYSPKGRVGCDKYVIPFNFGDIRLRHARYHVPEHLQPHINYIPPSIRLTPVVKRTVKAKRGTHTL